MFGGSFDLAILSGPLALPGLTSGKAVLVVWVYAIAGVCGLRDAPRRFCPIAAITSWAFYFSQPELSGGALSWHRHCAIPQAAFEDSLPPAPQSRRNPRQGGGVGAVENRGQNV
ncbi:MAG: hypothetical protein GDA36_11310 [Rhodobacteraceae bacterium]|nr:hypothetical protein [Paracoccaceae bacterium]